MSRKNEDLRTLLASVPSEARIISIESDLKSIRERIARLEEQQQQKSSKEERHFKVKLALIGIIGPILAAIITYVLTKLGLLP